MVRIFSVGVRNGSKNMSTWSNPLKYNFCDTIKKWYLFPDLGGVCTTNEKAGFFKPVFLLCQAGSESTKQVGSAAVARRAQERR